MSVIFLKVKTLALGENSRYIPAISEWKSAVDKVGKICPGPSIAQLKKPCGNSALVAADTERSTSTMAAYASTEITICVSDAIDQP